MKTKTHVGNITFLTCGPYVVLGKKRPKQSSDKKRKRQRVSIGKWTPLGGGREPEDKTHKAGARREVFQESGIDINEKKYVRVGTLLGYIGKNRKPLWRVYIYRVELDEKILPKPNEEYEQMSWFRFDLVPYKQMLETDRKWIPVLLGTVNTYKDRIHVSVYSEEGDINRVTKCVIR